MSKYTNAKYPDKANDFINNDGMSIGKISSASVKPLTVAPTEDNVSDKIQVVLLNAEPETRYKGYIYVINLLQYTITKIATRCTITGADTIRETEDIELTLSVDEGCLLPIEISVTGAISTYNHETGIITLSNPTDNVVITAAGSIVYNITTSVVNGVSTGSSYCTIDRNGEIIISANEGYFLPETITVTNSEYEYNSSSGVVTIYNPSDDISISAECSVYNITTNVVNGSVTGDTIIAPNYGTATITLIPNENYTTPYDVTVNNADYSYDYSTGQIILTNASGDVEISINCLQSSYNITSNIDNTSYIGSSTIAPHTSISIQINANEGYKFKELPTVSGDGTFTINYTEQNGVIITLSNISSNIEINGLVIEETVSVMLDKFQYDSTIKSIEFNK